MDKLGFDLEIVQLNRNDARNTRETLKITHLNILI